MLSSSPATFTISSGSSAAPIPTVIFAFHGYGPVYEIRYSSGPSVTTTTVSGKSSVQLVGHVYRHPNKNENVTWLNLSPVVINFVLTFESVDRILWYDFSNENSDSNCGLNRYCFHIHLSCVGPHAGRLTEPFFFHLLQGFGQINVPASPRETLNKLYQKIWRENLTWISIEHN